MERKNNYDNDLGIPEIQMKPGISYGIMTKRIEHLKKVLKAEKKKAKKTS